MRSLPLDIGVIHFVGVGGIGMSGLAEVTHNLGYTVRGSDVVESANLDRLRALRVPVAVGHAAANVADASVVVASSAIRATNPELVAARERAVPVVSRAEMLAELMRLKWCIAVAGTHGKTTTTSIISALLDAAEFDPTVINGGIVNAYGSNARLGTGEWMVVEADESDGTFVRLPATIATITNIDPEHLDFYGDYNALRAAFRAFVQNIPFYGAAVLCADHPEVQKIVGRISDRRVVTYGLSPHADVRAVDVRPSASGSDFAVVLSDRVGGETERLDDLHLPMPGTHNVQNALAGVAVARELGIDCSVMRRALSEFRGVARRFSRVGEARGITVIDDYAHHPVEIAAVLAAARSAYFGRVIAVVQPHRYTRLRNLFEDFCSCFGDADAVVVAEVYAAGEEPIPGIGGAVLAQGLREQGHRLVVPLDRSEELPVVIAELAGRGDVVVCVGAGSITHWARLLPRQLMDLTNVRQRAKA